MSAHPKRPAWLSLPIYSPLSDWTSHPPIPRGWLAYEEDEDRAYCHVHGISFYPRTKPPYFDRAPHPRSAYRSLP